jgi:protein-tyrosine-phosphatase
MAEGLIRARLEATGMSHLVSVSSAGTWAEDGLPATHHAVRAAAERNVDISCHRSREVSRELVGPADLILVMTASHAEALRAEFPDAGSRVQRISALAGGAWDVADPVGGSLDDYRATAAELARLIAAGWDEITGT